MKNKKIGIINVILVCLIVAIIMIYSLSIEKYVKYTDNLIELSNYYKILGDMEKSNGYKDIANVISYGLIIVIPFVAIFSIKIKKVIIDRKYKNYSQIIHDYRGYYFFEMTNMLLLLNLWFLIIIILSGKFNFFAFNISLLLLVIFINLFGNKIYNQVNSKIIELGTINNDIINDEDTTFKKYKINKIFYIILIVTILTFGFTTIKLISNIEYTKYPESLEIDDKYNYDDTIKYWHFEPYNLYLFNNDRKKEDKIISKITLVANSKESMKILAENDYEIFIIYNDEEYYLEDDDFVLKKSNDEFEYQIDLDNYFNKNNIKRDRFQRISLDFVDSETKDTIYEVSTELDSIVWRIYK